MNFNLGESGCGFAGCFGQDSHLKKCGEFIGAVISQKRSRNLTGLLDMRLVTLNGHRKVRPGMICGMSKRPLLGQPQIHSDKPSFICSQKHAKHPNRTNNAIHQNGWEKYVCDYRRLHAFFIVDAASQFSVKLTHMLCGINYAGVWSVPRNIRGKLKSLR